MKIVLCGPPRSGKSCFREGLKQAIRAIPGAPYPLALTCCPDGEGAWFQAAVDNDPEVAARCKAAYKSKFTPEFVRRVADSVWLCQLPLVLVDIGGIPSAENEEICAGATHAIILSGKPEAVAEWQQFCTKVGLPIVAEVGSEYTSMADRVPEAGEDRVWRGAVHHLERGEPVASRPTIKKIAEVLVQMVAITGAAR